MPKPTSTLEPQPAGTQPPGADAALVLDDGSIYWGRGFGAATADSEAAVGEVCFNTSLTGYQEILTDPSYAGQIITFTFPHIGNVGTNPEDIETVTPAVRGCVLRTDITDPSNWRAVNHLDEWLKSMNLPAIAGVDTRKLTRRIRDHGAPNGAIVYAPDGPIDTEGARAHAESWPGLNGMDLARNVTCAQTYEWDGEGSWSLEHGYAKQDKAKHHVVAVDFGAKRNILRCLANAGCKVTVVPATASFDNVMQHKPDGVFFSNGPGDPAATGTYAVPMVTAVLSSGIPSFGICLGHQLMALSLGASTSKMHLGHRGANHPVKDLETGKVEVTSQNHGFVVERDSLPDSAVETHTSLFDGSLEGIAVKDMPIFSVQYHPEASPGPQDSHYLFERFIDLMRNVKI